MYMYNSEKANLNYTLLRIEKVIHLAYWLYIDSSNGSWAFIHITSFCSYLISEDENEIWLM